MSGQHRCTRPSRSSSTTTVNYDRFARTRAERLETTAAKQAKRRPAQDMQAFVDRFKGQGSKARQHSSAVFKMIEKLGRSPRRSEERHPAFNFGRTSSSAFAIETLDVVSRPKDRRPLVLAKLDLRSDMDRPHRACSARSGRTSRTLSGCLIGSPAAALRQVQARRA